MAAEALLLWTLLFPNARLATKLVGLTLVAELVQLLHGSVVPLVLLLHGSNLVKAAAEALRHGRTVAATMVDTAMVEAMEVQLVLLRHGPTEVEEAAAAAVQLLGSKRSLSKLHGSNSNRLIGNSSLAAMIPCHLHLPRISHRHHHQATFHHLHHRLRGHY